MKMKAMRRIGGELYQNYLEGESFTRTNSQRLERGVGFYAFAKDGQFVC